jgi:hypothetical protein
MQTLTVYDKDNKKVGEFDFYHHFKAFLRLDVELENVVFAHLGQIYILSSHQGTLNITRCTSEPKTTPHLFMLYKRRFWRDEAHVYGGHKSLEVYFLGEALSQLGYSVRHPGGNCLLNCAGVWLMRSSLAPNLTIHDCSVTPECTLDAVPVFNQVLVGAK